MSLQHTHYTSNFISKTFPIIIICDGVQSPSNIGSLFRISDALGVSKIIFCKAVLNINSTRLKKTARNTQKNVQYSESSNILVSIEKLKKEEYKIIALEITDSSISLKDFSETKNKKIAIIIGNEQHGVSKEVLKCIHQSVHIDMFGENSSMNVVQATSIAIHAIINKLYIY